MKIKNTLLSFISIIFISSCGGGGGSAAPFSMSLGPDKIETINEDVAFSSSFNVSTNYNSSITYSVTSIPLNGSVNFDTAGNFIYTPNLNFNGTDSFSVNISATQRDEQNQAVGTPISNIRNVDLTINPVNDAPTISVTSDLSSYDDSTIIDADNLNIFISVNDVDTDMNSLSFYGMLDMAEQVGASYNSLSGSMTVDLSSLTKAGVRNLNACVSDGELSTCDTSNTIETYFIANKTAKTIGYNCDSNEANCNASSQYDVFYLVGGPNEVSKTNYVFIADALSNVVDKNLFRDKVLDSVSLLSSSDIGYFFTDFFNVIIAEESNPSGASPFEIETGCYNLSNIYCIGDISRTRISNMFNGYSVAAFLSTTSGRGVAQGNVNVQYLDNDVEETVMHELGHSHGEMNDEYDSQGERSVSAYEADLGVNTTSVTDPNNVKWKHHIEDLTNVPGYHYDICYNYSDGDIYYRDQVGDGTYEECECYVNQFPGTTYSGANTIADCVYKIGHIPGTYYGEDDTFRPIYQTVMEYGSEFGYGAVNVEGFAVGSIMNQGFANYKINTISGDNALRQSSLGSEITFEVEAEYDQSKLTLKWAVDGVVQSNLDNQLTVTFARPANNQSTSYSWYVVDNSGRVSAPNDPLDPLDFYEGWFEREYYYQPDPDLSPLPSLNPYIGSWEWYDSSLGYAYDNSVSESDRADYQFGQLCCSLGVSFIVNWNNYSDSSGQNEKNSNQIKYSSASVEKRELIYSLNMDENNIYVSNIVNDFPTKDIIKKPTLSKKDDYVIYFYNSDDELIYQYGIGNPFRVNIQHIGHEKEESFIGYVPVKNYNIAIPSELNPASLSLAKRIQGKEYSEIKRISLN